RFAPLGELKVYVLTEAEVYELARGAASIHLNFALFFWGVAISLGFALIATTIPSTRKFVVFVVFFAATLIAGVIFSVLSYIHHRSSGNLLKRILARMPPAPSIQETI